MICSSEYAGVFSWALRFWRTRTKSRTSFRGQVSTRPTLAGPRSLRTGPGTATPGSRSRATGPRPLTDESPVELLPLAGDSCGLSGRSFQPGRTARSARCPCDARSRVGLRASFRACFRQGHSGFTAKREPVRSRRALSAFSTSVSQVRCASTFAMPSLTAPWQHTSKAVNPRCLATVNSSQYSEISRRQEVVMFFGSTF